MKRLLFASLICMAIAEFPLPYRPSGWRPRGRQFPLPTELKETYGPSNPMVPPMTLGYGPPKQKENKPTTTQDYGLPKDQYIVPEGYKTLQVQELPINLPPKDWQNIESSLGWSLTEEKPGYIWGKKGPISDESCNDDSVEQETQRILEQIRHYRIKNSVRNGQTLPANFDSDNYKQRFAVRSYRYNDPVKQPDFQGRIQQQFSVKQETVLPPSVTFESIPKVDNYPKTKYGPPIFSMGPPYRTATKPTQIPDLSTEIPEITTDSVEDEEGTNDGQNPTSLEEQDEDEENDNRPNVAISNAVSKQGQYYVLQPNGQLQRVTYKTAPGNPESKDGPVISNLKYENVKPINDPIYTYQNERLVRIN